MNNQDFRQKMDIETVRNHLLKYPQFKGEFNPDSFKDEDAKIGVALRVSPMVITTRYGGLGHYVVQAKVRSYGEWHYDAGRYAKVGSLKQLDARIKRHYELVAEKREVQAQRIAAAEAEYVTFQKVFDEVTAGLSVFKRFINMPIKLNMTKHYMGHDQSAYIEVNEQKFTVWLTGDHDIAVARIQVDFRINDQRYLIPLEDFINDRTIEALFFDKNLEKYAT
tara:strand:- start:708 stop:1373 length:666 start_codon:yes stop_codon:yes gene_type:complete